MGWFDGKWWLGNDWDKTVLNPWKLKVETPWLKECLSWTSVWLNELQSETERFILRWSVELSANQFKERKWFHEYWWNLDTKHFSNKSVVWVIWFDELCHDNSFKSFIEKKEDEPWDDFINVLRLKLNNNNKEIWIPYYVFETKDEWVYEIVFYQKVWGKDKWWKGWIKHTHFNWKWKTTWISIKVKAWKEQKIELKFDEISWKILPFSDTLDIKNLNIELNINLEKHISSQTGGDVAWGMNEHAKVDINFSQKLDWTTTV